MTIIDLLRTPKLFDMSLFDWFSILLGVYFINNLIQQHYIIKNRNILDLITSTVVIIIGIITHKIFNIPTKLGFYLALNNDPRIS
jgi:hypothetical protein